LCFLSSYPIIFYWEMVSLFTSVTCNTISTFLSLQFFMVSLFWTCLAWKLYDTTQFPFNVKVYGCSHQIRGSWFQECSMCDIRASICKTRLKLWCQPFFVKQSNYNICKARETRVLFLFLFRNIWFWRFYWVARCWQSWFDHNSRQDLSSTWNCTCL